MEWHGKISLTQYYAGTADLEEDQLGGRLHNDTSHETGPSQPRRHLKYSDGVNPVALVPQPSDDPNDPLNWPLAERDRILAILCVLSVIASTLSPLLAANTLTLTLHFRRSFTDIALLTGYHLLGVAVGGLIFVPSARVWGKRHLYLLGTVIVIFSSIWGGASSHSYTSLLWARVFQGIGLAPFEALVNASVADLFFVHERGKRMALSALALFGGAFFTPVVVGKMTSTLGWEWCFWFIAIFTGCMLPLVIFYCPETTFVRDNEADGGREMFELGEDSDRQRQAYSGDGVEDRVSSSTGYDDRDGIAHEMLDYSNNGSVNSDAALSHELKGQQHQHSRLEKDDTTAHFAVKSSSPTTMATSTPSTLATKRERTPYLQTLRLFPRTRFTKTPYHLLLLRPLPLLISHPTILYASVTQGLLIGWTVLIGIILAAIMLLPPLSFNEVETGYMYVGAFIGALIGFAISGFMADYIPTRIIAKKYNNGVWEPEFRLILVIPQVILGCAGLYGFGIVSNDVRKYGWFWPDFFFALEVAGMVVGAVAASLYVADSCAGGDSDDSVHRGGSSSTEDSASARGSGGLQVEAFTAMLIFKNVFSFGLTWSGYDWLVEAGIRKVFIAVASVQLGVLVLSTVLMYVFGKRNRAFFARHDILAWFKLR
ncbi:hypothetical protein AAFC00_003640 [Neodothiora populina]|uniref:Major facilitator superfamily (MFS) profile domain-containing protein n=1 Tax=Neodothiora populina TaxID=2781224 RepID=A0ABR3PFZ4_9PEZI